jgi:hypothetical protein
MMILHYQIQILNGGDSQLREESDEDGPEVVNEKPKRKRVRTAS